MEKQAQELLDIIEKDPVNIEIQKFIGCGFTFKTTDPRVRAAIHGKISSILIQESEEVQLFTSFSIFFEANVKYISISKKGTAKIWIDDKKSTHKPIEGSIKFYLF